MYATAKELRERARSYLELAKTTNEYYAKSTIGTGSQPKLSGASGRTPGGA